MERTTIQMKTITVLATLFFGTTIGYSQTVTLQSLKGVYVFTERGDVGNRLALAGLGILTLDGQGNATCSETIQTQGANLSTTCSGTYYINIDGSARVQILHTVAADPNDLVTEPQTFIATYKLLVTGGGSQLKGIRTDNGVAVIADFSK